LLPSGSKNVLESLAKADGAAVDDNADGREYGTGGEKPLAADSANE
jgi:hypothetical protein